jgi:hypothetical protein
MLIRKAFAERLWIADEPELLVEAPGGFGHTSTDCAAWMQAAGFSTTWAEPLVGPDSMVIGTK